MEFCNQCGKRRSCGICFPSLYNLAIQKLVKCSSFDPSQMGRLPAIVKEDVLRVALHWGIARDRVSCFLHPKIRALYLNDSKISEEDLKNISQCKEVRILEINPPPLERYDHSSEALIQLFSSLKLLVKLCVQKNDGLTDEVISCLASNCPSIQLLDVAACRYLTYASAVCLSTLPNLSFLNLSRTFISDEGLTALACGPCSHSLKELSLYACVQVTSECFYTLFHNFKNLSLVIFKGCPRISQQQVLNFLEEHLLLQERVCCHLPPTYMGLCQHNGCILKLHSGLLILC